MKSRCQSQSWLLLAVIVLMQLVNAFHIHEPQAVAQRVECDMCDHHVNHSGHFISDRYHMHPCLTCQLGSNQYIAPKVLHISGVTQLVAFLDCQSTVSLPAPTLIHRQSRAPPVI